MSADGLSCTCGGPSGGPGVQYWTGAACITCGGPNDNWDPLTLACVTCGGPNQNWDTTTYTCIVCTGPQKWCPKLLACGMPGPSCG